ncbi:amidase [Tateyamaria pelophila]|uniref:amidase n=1 Tax=Tateyamaria pelophila TaxID=328415 RepID=UPI001CBB362B|nr:amidase [Tateyamaria pelophila]
MEICETDALVLSAALAAGEVSAVEVMQATLARIATWNGAVNAIVSLCDDDAVMAEAAEADKTPSKGWLHGIPIAIKETGNAKGLQTCKGSPLLLGQVAEHDDIAVGRLRAAGAIVIGKTNVPEFGLGSHSVNPVFGATRNPYDTSRSAGGSSGGAGVALATGMTCVADGSDIMGSLRNPAAWNNVYGLRPSHGVVPSEPRGDTFLQEIATNGPMARSPRDLAAMLDTMAGPDPRQPNVAAHAPSLPQMHGDLTGLRIAWLGDWGGAFAMEPGVIDLCAAALTSMEAQGQRVDVLSAPFDLDAMWRSWITLRSFFLAGHMSPLYADERMRGQLNANVLWEIEKGLSLRAMDVHKASVVRSDWFKTAATLFETYDVLALPSAQMWPFDVTLDWPREINGVQMDTYHRWMEVVVPASLIGLPAISVPVGFGGPDDLPMGLQLIGRRGADAKLLQLAERWHQATHWPRMRSPKVPT